MVGMRLQSVGALITGECRKDTQYTTQIFYLSNAVKCYKPCLLDVLYRYRKLCIVQKHIVGRVAQSVYRLSYGLDGPGSNPGGDEFSRV